MTAFIEGSLEFKFATPPWNARHWDQEPAYRERIARLRDTKATDFVAARKDGLLFLEVKDFRGHRIANKQRLSDGELAVEVAQKVRDTIAGLVGARRTGGDAAEWAPFVDGATNAKRSCHVILWIEQDVPPRAAPGTLDRARNSLEQLLKQQLRWLTTHVFVASLERAHRLADVGVRNI